MAGSNQTLQIKMFGKFSMKNGNYAFPQEKKKSKQVGLLFAYLLANRNVETSKSKLIEVLWPEEDSGTQRRPEEPGVPGSDGNEKIFLSGMVRKRLF